MDDRFGYDGGEGLIFDRTKPCKDCDHDDPCGLFEEITLDELIEHANSMESKLREWQDVARQKQEIIDTERQQVEHQQQRAQEAEFKLAESEKDREQFHAWAMPQITDRVELLNKLAAADEAWHEQEDELQALRGKLAALQKEHEALIHDHERVMDRENSYLNRLDKALAALNGIYNTPPTLSEAREHGLEWWVELVNDMMEQAGSVILAADVEKQRSLAERLQELGFSEREKPIIPGKRFVPE